MIFVAREINLSCVDDQYWGIVVIVEELCVAVGESVEIADVYGLLEVDTPPEYALLQNPGGSLQINDKVGPWWHKLEAAVDLAIQVQFRRVQDQGREEIVFFDHEVGYEGAIEQIISRHILNLLGTL